MSTPTESNEPTESADSAPPQTAAFSPATALVRIGGVTLACLVALTAIVLVILPDLPAQVASHWGAGLEADDFVARSRVWTMLLIPWGTAVVLLPLAWVSPRLPREMRWLGGLPAGIAVGIGTIIVGTLLPQRGLTDAGDMSFPGWVIPVAVVLGSLVAVATTRLVPIVQRPRSDAPAPQGAARADLPTDRLVVWSAATPSSRAMAVVLAGVGVLGLVLAVLVSWWMLALFAVIIVPLVSSTSFTVTIGPAGIRATGIGLGWPRLEIPLDTVVAADATTTSFGQFGGWGLRMGPNLKQMGVVTRFGTALRIERTDGVDVVITLDDPDEPAAIVNTLLDRRGGEAGSDDRSASDGEAAQVSGAPDEQA